MNTISIDEVKKKLMKPKHVQRYVRKQSQNMLTRCLRESVNGGVKGNQLAAA